MKSSVEILSRRYAQAYMHLFGDQLTLEVVTNLPILANFLEKHRSILIFASLHGAKEQNIRRLIELFKLAGVDSSLIQRLIEMVSLDNRLNMLPWILRKMYAYYLDMNNIVHFTIESALPLHENEQNAFVAFLHEKTGKQILSTIVVNPNLIAGVKIYSDALGFEHSVQQLLFELAYKVPVA